MSFKTALAATILAASFVLVGCTPTVPVNYSPSSTLTASGAVDVADFKYQPAIDGEVKPNQLKNTAIGSVLLDKDVAQFFRDAVFTELRFVGVKVGGSKVVLSGDIKEFLLDDLGFHVDWTLDVQYVVTDSAGKTIYDSEKVTKNTTTKFVGAFTALNQQMKQNIESLIEDPAFIKAIN